MNTLYLSDFRFKLIGSGDQYYVSYVKSSNVVYSRYTQDVDFINYIMELENPPLRDLKRLRGICMGHNS